MLEQNEPDEQLDETLTPLSVLGALGERFAANTRAQIDLATSVRDQTVAIQKSGKRTWLIVGLVVLSCLSIVSTVVMALVLADVDTDLQAVDKNTQQIGELTGDISTFVNQVRSSMTDGSSVDRSYIETQLVPTIAEASARATVQALIEAGMITSNG